MTIERGLNDAALYTSSAPMNDPYVSPPGRRRGGDVLVNHRRDVSRSERVKVELAFDWNPDRTHAGCVAVTTVVMPPRTEKSPTTVIRRG